MYRNAGRSLPNRRLYIRDLTGQPVTRCICSGAFRPVESDGSFSPSRPTHTHTNIPPVIRGKIVGWLLSTKGGISYQRVIYTTHHHLVMVGMALLSLDLFHPHRIHHHTHTHTHSFETGKYKRRM